MGIGWKGIEVEGRRMWERCDGVRVESSDQIAAIERQERESWERRRDPPTWWVEPEDEPTEGSPWMALAVAGFGVVYLAGHLLCWW